MKYDKKTKSIVIENCGKCPFQGTYFAYTFEEDEGFCELYKMITGKSIWYEVNGDDYLWNKCPLIKQPITFILSKGSKQ